MPTVQPTEIVVILVMLLLLLGGLFALRSLLRR